MAQNLSGYHRALDLFEGLVAGVPRDGWDAPSPCARWTARDVAGHVTGGQHLVRALACGGPVPDVTADPARFVPGDVRAAWDAAREECAAALTPEALRRPVPVGALGELPLGDYLGGYVLEPLAHAWDLAVATGQPSRLDPGLVHHAFATAHLIAAPLRAAGHLAPALPVPRGADEQTRLLAFLGRASDGPADGRGSDGHATGRATDGHADARTYRA
ncbi:TIGR03086 family metal-binding protein [Actinomadura sp. NEAU-AAG7]|uniref:TIGR03086 family metal-binding protein n=1 Tax=Actinomadura sp. NEAU-AAG7 TaxID=2839640 RepID=UPI001BE4D37A|nr:TIGR03086 family metal-binding protein [Actinomadura sp. NEAU-AAG7]MBT2214009.1 TIGR03086 family protein [Actinomadura sp. NEAU-AAG7]